MSFAIALSFAAFAQAGGSPAIAPAPPPAPLFSADFESGSLAGWSTPDVCRREGFESRVADGGARGSLRCACVEHVSEPPSDGMGNLIADLDASALGKKRVRLSASVRVEGEGRAQLWLRADAKDPQTYSALLDNMSDRPIRSGGAGEWQEYQIVADVDPRAATLVFGLMLFEGGRAFLDDVRIDVLGDTAAFLEPARALDERGRRNLIAFAHLFGCVRHFHPSDQVQRTDWDAAAIAGVRAIEGARDDAQLIERMNAFCAPIAPTVQVFDAAQAPALPAALARPDDTRPRLVRMRHHGFGQGRAAESVYSSGREKASAPDGKPRDGWDAPSQVYEAEIVKGIRCRVPLALWYDAKGTLPHVETPAGLFAASDGFVASGDDRASRLSAIVLGWNVFQHFYPYFDVTGTDWQHELELALPRAASDADGVAFLETLQRLVASLHDGHGRVSWPREPARATPGVRWSWIGSELVVTRPVDGVDLVPGDVIVSIDGVPTEECYRRIEPLISSATPQFARFRSIGLLGAGPIGSQVVLEARALDGKLRKVSVARGPKEVSKLAAPDRPEKIAPLGSDVWYVDLGRIEQQDFDAALPNLASAKGLVFDLRGYPTIWTDPLAHLIEKPIRCAQWLVPTPRRPNREQLTFDKSDWSVEPKEPRFTQRVAFLTDGRAISAAETFMGLVEFHKLGAIVGEPTAGTNGNVNPFVLPGGYRVSWTGMKVLKQDGSRHHGVGIQPTVPCSRTKAGLAAGRDEQLEKALELVR